MPSYKDYPPTSSFQSALAVSPDGRRVTPCADSTAVPAVSSPVVRHVPRCGDPFRPGGCQFAHAADDRSPGDPDIHIRPRHRADASGVESHSAACSQPLVVRRAMATAVEARSGEARVCDLCGGDRPGFGEAPGSSAACSAARIPEARLGDGSNGEPGSHIGPIFVG